MFSTGYYFGHMLCSSSDVSRLVRNDIRPDDYSNSHSHRNFFHELTSVVDKMSSKGLSVNNYTSGPMFC